MWSKAFAIGIASLLLGAPVSSQTSQQDDAQYVVNAGVARISLIKGDVTFQRGDSGDWEAAAINLPMAEGDKVAVGSDGRTEIQLSGDNYIRLFNHSELRSVRLGQSESRFMLVSGTAIVHVSRIDEDIQLRIDTPSTNITFNKRGDYRINLLDGGDTEFQVRKGQAEISWTNGVLDLKSGRGILIRAQDPTNYEITRDLRTDDWDRWSEDRDRYLADRQVASRYVSPSIWGARDLDYYGSWHYFPSYGYCWFPSVSFGWVPYRLGRWVWAWPYGWTWLSYEPWGWAPYHFGGWSFFAGFGWGWFPGPFYHRHFFRPALVTFVSFQGGGSRYVGWIPWSRESFSFPGQTLPLTNDRFSGLNVAGMTDVAKLPRELQQAMSVLPEAGFRKGDRPLQYSTELKTKLNLEEARILPQKALSTEMVGGKAMPPLALAERPSRNGPVQQLGSPKDPRTVPLDSTKARDIQRDRWRQKNYEPPQAAQSPDRNSGARDRKSDRQIQSDQGVFRGEGRPKSAERPESSAPPMKSREPGYQRQESAPSGREARPEPKSPPRVKESAPSSARSYSAERGYSQQPERGYGSGSGRGYAPAPERSYSPKFERGPSYSAPSPRYSAPPSHGGGGMSSQSYRKGRG